MKKTILNLILILTFSLETRAGKVKKERKHSKYSPQISERETTIRKNSLSRQILQQVKKNKELLLELGKLTRPNLISLAILMLKEIDELEYQYKALKQEEKEILREIKTYKELEELSLTGSMTEKK